jgi:hypothetical protein
MSRGVSIKGYEGVIRMTVRNFWIEATVDGRKTPIAFGPRAKDGGFELKIYQREEGSSVHVLTIRGEMWPRGTRSSIDRGWPLKDLLCLKIEPESEFMNRLLTER